MVLVNRCLFQKFLLELFELKQNLMRTPYLLLTKNDKLEN